MSQKHHHQSKSRRFDADEDRPRSTSRTVIYEEPSSTSQRTLSSTIRQVIPSSSTSSFYNTSTTEKKPTNKSLTIRDGKHSRTINSEIYSSEIVEDDEQDEEKDRHDEMLDEILYSTDERTKRRRNSSSHSAKSDGDEPTKMKKTSSRDQRRSPSEEGEEQESQSERSDDQPKVEEEEMIVEPGRSRFDDQDEEEVEEKKSDDDEEKNSSHRRHRHHRHHRHHHHKRSRRHSSSTPQSAESKNDLASPLPLPPSTTNFSQPAETNPLDERVRLPIYYPAIQGCRRVDEYKCLNRIEEGAYGVVFRAKDVKTGDIVALKRLKMEKEKEGFPITSLREICCILKSQHENVCTVREIVVGEDMNRIFIVMDYVEHDLKSLMTHTMKKPFSIGEVKTLMFQMLSGVNHLHDNWIIHRDLKTSNLLLSNKGILKIGDFGLAREYGSPLKPYTPIVVTLWYRAPELLLGIKEYSCPIDIWSVGAIFGELLLMKPLFPGKSELDQLNRIFKDLGTPNEKIWPEYNSLPFTKKMNFSLYPYNRLRSRFDASLSEKGFDLLNKFLAYDPTKRISAGNALKHPYFDEIPRRIDPSMFPTWPSRNEEKEKNSTALPRLPGSSTATVPNEPKPPSGGKMYEKLLGDDDSDTVERNLPPPSGFQLRG